MAAKAWGPDWDVVSYIVSIVSKPREATADAQLMFYILISPCDGTTYAQGASALFSYCPQDLPHSDAHGCVS